jgi:hypothetical protein
MRLAQQEKVSGLRDVLRGGAPMHIAAKIAIADAVELPDERHKGMSGTG